MRALRDKYLEMRALRTDAPGDDPAARLRALSARFPGALREIDELPLEVIEARIAILDRVLAGAVAAPRWARCLDAYHGWMRAALAVRRHAGRARDRAAALRFVEHAYAPGPGEPPAEALRAALDALLRPPSGRLTRWVFSTLALHHGADAAELEAEAFPPSPARAARSARDGSA